MLWHLLGALGASPTEEKSQVFPTAGRQNRHGNIQAGERRQAGREVSPEQGTGTALQIHSPSSAQ